MKFQENCTNNRKPAKVWWEGRGMWIEDFEGIEPKGNIVKLWL